MTEMPGYFSRFSLLSDKASFKEGIKFLEDLTNKGKAVAKAFEQVQKTFKLSRAGATDASWRYDSKQITSQQTSLERWKPNFQSAGGPVNHVLGDTGICASQKLLTERVTSGMLDKWKPDWQASNPLTTQDNDAGPNTGGWRYAGGNYKPGMRSAGSGGGGNWYTDVNKGGGGGDDDGGKEDPEKKSEKKSSAFRTVALLYILKKIVDFLKHLIEALAKLTIASVNQASALRMKSDVTGVSTLFAKQLQQAFKAEGMDSSGIMDKAKAITEAKAGLMMGQGEAFSKLATSGALLGLKPQDFLKQSTEQILKSIMDAVAKGLGSTDSATRDRARMAGGELLGEEGLQAAFLMSQRKQNASRFLQAGSNSLGTPNATDQAVQHEMGKVQNAWDETLNYLGRMIGKDMLPNLKAFNEWFDKNKDTIRANLEWLAGIAATIGNIVLELVKSLTSFISDLRSFFTEVGNTIEEVFHIFGKKRDPKEQARLDDLLSQLPGQYAADAARRQAGGASKGWNGNLDNPITVTNNVTVTGAGPDTRVKVESNTDRTSERANSGAMQRINQ